MPAAREILIAVQVSFDAATIYRVNTRTDERKKVGRIFGDVFYPMGNFSAVRKDANPPFTTSELRQIAEMTEDFAG